MPSKRYVRRSLDQDLFEEVQTAMEQPEFCRKMSERMWKAEGLFAGSETESRFVAGQVSRQVESADPGVLVRHGAEPETPGLPVLPLVVDSVSNPQTVTAKSPRPHF